MQELHDVDAKQDAACWSEAVYKLHNEVDKAIGAFILEGYEARLSAAGHPDDGGDIKLNVYIRRPRSTRRLVW